MKNRKVDVQMPYLVNSEMGIYFVEYKAFCPATNKLERYRHYRGFKKLKTFEEIKKHADHVIRHYGNKLRSGWRPWDGTDFIYQDEISYHQTNKVNGKERKDDNHIRRHLSDFLAWKKNDIAEKSFQSYQSKTRLFCLWLENNGHDKKLISEISNDIVIDFFNYLIRSRNLDKRTVAKYKQNLYQMFRYFSEKKLVEEIPLNHLPKSIKKVDAAARPITDNDVRLYMNYVAEADQQLYLASVFQMLTLVRPNREMRLMKIQDIDPSRGIAYVRDETAKTRARVVTLPNALIEITREYQLHRYPGNYYIFARGGKPGPKPVGVNYFNRKFSEIKKELNLPETYKFYSFKHTGAGKLMESGASLAELMSHLGHTRFESTIHYVRRHFGERSDKIANFRPDFLNPKKT